MWQVDQGGTIDPFMFVDDDGSNDGNAVGKPCWVSICLLSPDGLKVSSLGSEQLTCRAEDAGIRPACTDD